MGRLFQIKKLLMGSCFVFVMPFQNGVAETACSILGNQGIFPEKPETIVPSLIKQAGEAILNLRAQKNFGIRKKSNFADLKTKGDCTSQTIIFNELKKIYPDHQFSGEEKCDGSEGEGISKKSDAPVWLLDPIDGTTNYVHGLPHFSISLAVAVGDEICYGAVYAPIYKELFYAKKNGGAWLKSSGKLERISVSNIGKLDSSIWITGFQAGKEKRISQNIPIFEDILSRTHGVRRHGSAALDLAFVASGRAEGYWELYIDWWGIAAGLLLVEEAGGKVFIVNSPDRKKMNSRNFSKLTLGAQATNGKDELHLHVKNLLLKNLVK